MVATSRFETLIGTEVVNPRLAMVERFIHEQLRQRVIFGWGCFAELEVELDRLNARRVMLIAGRSSRAHADRASTKLKGQVVARIPIVRPHVQLEDVKNARKLARDERVDVVLTVGGGSATGLGKTVAVEGPLLMTVPTTYAGSEATPIYGITSRGRKKTDRDPRGLPQVVIYDPELTISLPRRVTASSGLNAIAHCVEALYAEAPSPISRVLAVEGIRTLARSLPTAARFPEDRGARSSALYGAYLAGTVLATTGMAIHHRICHVLGGTFGLSHGDANAVLLPHVVAFNKPAAPDAIAQVAGALDQPNAAAALWDLARFLGAPTSLREIGFRDSDITEAATLAIEDDHYNPRPVTRDDVVAILQAAFEGSCPIESETREHDGVTIENAPDGDAAQQADLWEALVDEASIESFPASDPPSYWARRDTDLPP